MTGQPSTPARPALRLAAARHAWEAILSAFWRAAALAIALLILLGISGEVICTLETAGGVQILHLEVPTPRFAPLVLTMLAWDLVLAGAAWVGLNSNRLGQSGPRGMALLALALSMTLWRVVTGRLWALATDAPGLGIGSRADVLAWWVVAMAIAVVKEPIAQTFQEEDDRLNFPLLAVFAWHHRKDWVFPSLGAIGLTMTALGLPEAVAEDLLNLTKIYLLGGAAWTIGARCLQVLAPVPEGINEGEPCPAPSVNPTEPKASDLPGSSPPLFFTAGLSSPSGASDAPAPSPAIATRHTTPPTEEPPACS